MRFPWFKKKTNSNGECINDTVLVESLVNEYLLFEGNDSAIAKTKTKLLKYGDDVINTLLNFVLSCSRGYFPNDNWYYVCQDIVPYLSKFKSPIVKDALLEILKTDSNVVEYDRIRGAAAVELGNCGDSSLVGKLLPLIGQPHAPVRAIMEAIKKLGGDVPEIPEVILERSNELEGEEAIEYLFDYIAKADSWPAKDKAYLFFKLGFAVKEKYGEASSYPFFAAQVLTDPNENSMGWRNLPETENADESTYTIKSAQKIAKKYPLPKSLADIAKVYALPVIEKEINENEQRAKKHIVIIENANWEPLTDIDGNIYQTIKIGKQIWTVENLKTTKYNDGGAIPLVSDEETWFSFGDYGKPAYCWYDNDINNKERYGALYNWYAVNTGKLAPKGWHVPTGAEWTELEEYLIANGYNWGTTKYGIAKALAAKTDWSSNNNPGTLGNDLNKNNASSFSALPGGCRSFNSSFDGQSCHGFWWSATEGCASDAWYRCLFYDSENLFEHAYNRGCGYSVRLLRDN